MLRKRLFFFGGGKERCTLQPPSPPITVHAASRCLAVASRVCASSECDRVPSPSRVRLWRQGIDVSGYVYSSGPLAPTRRG